MFGNWNSIYEKYGETFFPGNRYPHEPVIQFIANLNRSLNIDNYVEESIVLNKKFSDEFTVEKKVLNKKALDIGFGTISDLIMLMDYGYRGFGVEVSEHAIQCAKRAIEHSGAPIVVSKYEPYRLEFSDNFFDLIISNASAYYNVDFADFLLETHRVLHDGGHFFHRMIAGDHGYFENNYAEKCHSNIYKWVRYPIDELNGVKFVCYNKEELETLFNKHFKDVKVSYLKYNYETLKQSWWIVTGKK